MCVIVLLSTVSHQICVKTIVGPCSTLLCGGSLEVTVAQDAMAACCQGHLSCSFSIRNLHSIWITVCVCASSHNASFFMCQDSCWPSLYLAVWWKPGCHCGKSSRVGRLCGSYVMAFLNFNFGITMGYCVCVCFRIVKHQLCVRTVVCSRSGWLCRRCLEAIVEKQTVLACCLGRRSWQFSIQTSKSKWVTVYVCVSS